MIWKPTSLGPRLEALMDERDHLHIQISLAAEAQKPDADQLDSMQKRLLQIEDEIARSRHRPNA